MLRSHSLLLNFIRRSSLIKHIENNKIVPDVIDCPPRKLLDILYGGGVKVTPGSILTPKQTEFEPFLSWDCDPKAYHTICMTDPDAPSRSNPEFREWHHWLMGNVLGCKQHTGKILSEYIACGPPKGTGLHRYVFLVFKQKDLLNFQETHLNSRSARGRAKFSIRKFAKKYKLGNPVAANFFFAEYDDFVPKLYSTLKN